jgi:hypothetical protein
VVLLTDCIIHRMEADVYLDEGRFPTRCTDVAVFNGGVLANRNNIPVWYPSHRIKKVEFNKEDAF